MQRRLRSVGARLQEALVRRFGRRASETEIDLLDLELDREGLDDPMDRCRELRRDAVAEELRDLVGDGHGWKW